MFNLQITNNGCVWTYRDYWLICTLYCWGWHILNKLWYLYLYFYKSISSTATTTILTLLLLVVVKLIPNTEHLTTTSSTICYESTLSNCFYHRTISQMPVCCYCLCELSFNIRSWKGKKMYCCTHKDSSKIPANM